MIQTILVGITFLIALGFILKKFLWTPIFETKKKLPKSVDGDKTKCGNSNCGCH